MKWFNNNSTDILSEDRLNILFDNIQHKVNQNYFDNHYPTLFTKGYADYYGYFFYPQIKKFLVKYIAIIGPYERETRFRIRYAKDLEYAKDNAIEEFVDHRKDIVDRSDIEVIEYPFNIND